MEAIPSIRLSRTLSGSADWTSGVYLALLTTSQQQYGPTTDPDHQSYITFVIREDSRVADILFQQAIATYQAYNNYPDDRLTGKNVYDDDSYGAMTTLGTQRAVKVSFDRPYTYSDHTGRGGTAEVGPLFHPLAGAERL